MAARMDDIVMVVQTNKTSVSSAEKAIKEISPFRLPLLVTVNHQVY